MSRRSQQRKEGICHICGSFGRLSLEHIPPKNSFNKNKITLFQGNDRLNLPLKGPMPKGEIIQGGYKVSTLCEYCNNNTGSWYSNDYRKWTLQADYHLSSTNRNSNILKEFRGRTLPFIKQIITMFVSIIGERFTEIHPEIRHFLLSKQCVGIPAKFRVYTYLNLPIRNRYEPVSSFIRPFGPTHKFAEVAVYPMGFLLAIESPPPDSRLLDITPFANFEYEFEECFHLPIPILASLGNKGTFYDLDQLKKI